MCKRDVEFLDLNVRRERPAGNVQLARSIVEQARALRAEFLHELWRQVLSWHRQRQGLAQLRALDDAALKDIGLHRSGIEAAVRHRGVPKPAGIAPKPPGTRQASPARPHLLLRAG